MSEKKERQSVEIMKELFDRRFIPYLVDGFELYVERYEVKTEDKTLHGIEFRYCYHKKDITPSMEMATNISLKYRLPEERLEICKCGDMSDDLLAKLNIINAGSPFFDHTIKFNLDSVFRDGDMEKYLSKKGKKETSKLIDYVLEKDLETLEGITDFFNLLTKSFLKESMNPKKKEFKGHYYWPHDNRLMMRSIEIYPWARLMYIKYSTTHLLKSSEESRQLYLKEVESLYDFLKKVQIKRESFAQELIKEVHDLKQKLKI